jgi:hypothetical protein
MVGGVEHVLLSDNIWDIPSHCLVFFKMVKTTNQVWNASGQNSGPRQIQAAIDHIRQQMGKIPTSRSIEGLLNLQLPTTN